MNSLLVLIDEPDPTAERSERSAPPEEHGDQPDGGMDRRRDWVLRMLRDRPEITRAVVADGDLDPVVVTLAVRNVGTCELLIPADRWDPFNFLRLLERHGGRA